MKKQERSSHRHQLINVNESVRIARPVAESPWDIRQIDTNTFIYFFKQYLQLSSCHVSRNKVIGRMEVG